MRLLYMYIVHVCVRGEYVHVHVGMSRALSLPQVKLTSHLAEHNMFIQETLLCVLWWVAGLGGTGSCCLFHPSLLSPHPNLNSY